MSNTDQTEDDPNRAFARSLFSGKPDETAEPDKQKPPLFVPLEGNISTPPRGDQDMRDFTRELFNRDA